MHSPSCASGVAVELCSMSAQSQFVRVHAGSHQLSLDGRPFYFAGANCYYLLVRSPGIMRSEGVQMVLQTWTRLMTHGTCPACVGSARDSPPWS